MNKEKLLLKLGILGVPESQAQQLKEHLDSAGEFVCQKDPGIEQGMVWLQESLRVSLDHEDAELLYKIACKNQPSPEVDYVEQGYDSCQSHRKISKVVSEAILLGGLIYESGLLGIKVDLNGAKAIVNSSLEIDESNSSELSEIARKYGAKQDFLFPGVTPSSVTTSSLDELAYCTLRGKPQTSVRTITGVGGLRYDKDWNYVTDWKTFVELKIEEDKRYYPGLAIFYLLIKNDPNSFPSIVQLKKDQPEVHFQLLEFIQRLKEVPKQQFQGVSVLCSAYVPAWSELKKYTGYTHPENHLELAESFHSPAYDFAVLKGVFGEIHTKGTISSTRLNQLSKLTEKLDHCWSFNSTIHLPWTAEFAGLSNDLIGRVTNQLGDHCIRYGVGHQGKSVEVREYHFGRDRKFPFGMAGKTAYGLRYYSQSDCFEGVPDLAVFTPEHPLWEAAEKDGFMKATLEFLEDKHE